MVDFVPTLGSRRRRMELLYGRLPDRCRQRPLVVLETMNWGATGRRALYGNDAEQGRCEIRLRLGLWRFPADWAHELGHLAEHWAVSAEAKAAWQRDWACLAPLMPTRYARQNAAEGFAECFVEVLLGRVAAGYERLPIAI